MTTQNLPRILCVDDEPNVVDGLKLHLRKMYEVHTALSGREALKKLEEIEDIAVIVSDMRMPEMDGATLLHRVVEAYPDITRILLTGETGRDAAVLAINEGQIFRFLSKPCPPDKLKATIAAAVGQHQLVSAERVLLQQTLIGCVKALIDALAMTNPVAFGRASRVKRLAMEFADGLGHKGFWQLEAAALLSQLGYLSLPVELVEKLYYGEHLTPEERALAGGVPQVARQLLGHIPRLEPVLEILEATNTKDEAQLPRADGPVGAGARILSLVLEYDGLVTAGSSVDVAMQSLRSHKGRFGEQLLTQFAQHVGAISGGTESRELPLRHVHPGMVLLQELRTHGGTLLVPRGFEVTEAFLVRMKNFGPGILAEKVKVSAPIHRRTASA